MDNNASAVTTSLERLLQEALQQGRLVLRFTPALEEQFVRHRQYRQRVRYVAGGLLAVFMYLLFIPLDPWFIPDIYPLSLIIRLSVVAVMLLGVAVVYRSRNGDLQDVVAILFAVFGAGSLMALFWLSRHANASYYYNGVMLVALFSNILLRLPFWRALLGSIVIFVTFVGAAFTAKSMTLPLAVNAVGVLLYSTALSLVANFLLESEARRLFLQDLLRDLYVQKLEASQLDLERLARIDSLTGVANRRWFDETLARMARDARRSGLPVSLLMVDADYFKAYNDAYGHVAGDGCLQRIAEAIGKTLYRPQDFLARYGGEEFAILLPQTSQEGALCIAQRVREMIEAMALEHHASPVAPHVTLSIGLASGIPVEDQEQALVNAADQALYAAKAGGRNQVRVSALAV